MAVEEDEEGAAGRFWSGLGKGSERRLGVIEISGRGDLEVKIGQLRQET